MSALNSPSVRPTIAKFTIRSPLPVTLDSIILAIPGVNEHLLPLFHRRHKGVIVLALCSNEGGLVRVHGLPHTTTEDGIQRAGKQRHRNKKREEEHGNHAMTRGVHATRGKEWTVRKTNLPSYPYEFSPLLHCLPMHRRHSMIYHSRLHVLWTIAILALPFLFFVYYSRLTSISNPELLTDIIVSGFRLLASFLIAAGLGWLMAVLFYEGKRSLIALPLFDVLQSFPTFAALPLGILVFGRSTTTVIVFLVFTIIWPIFFTILSSLKLSKHEWREVSNVYDLKGRNYLRLYLIPVTIPGLITGSVIGLGEGWEALIATEMIVGTNDGIGPFFQAFSDDATVTALGILGLLLLIFVINKLLWLPLLEWSHRTMGE